MQNHRTNVFTSKLALQIFFCSFLFNSGGREGGCQLLGGWALNLIRQQRAPAQRKRVSGGTLPQSYLDRRDRSFYPRITLHQLTFYYIRLHSMSKEKARRLKLSVGVSFMIIQGFRCASISCCHKLTHSVCDCINNTVSTVSHCSLQSPYTTIFVKIGYFP